jgi:hypothetical protein
MPHIEMKEIKIPADLVRKRPPSILFTIAKATFAALLLAVISFFALNALAIAALAIVGKVRNRSIDLAVAYRDVAFPAALGIFVVLWVGALIFFFRERKR